MTKYREILRLTALGLSLRNIQRSLHASQRTIMKVQHRAKELSLSWPLDGSLTDAELERQMFAKDTSPKSTKRMPDSSCIPSSAITSSRMSRSAAPPCISRENRGSRSR